jgi:hypothetical protein
LDVIRKRGDTILTHLSPNDVGRRTALGLVINTQTTSHHEKLSKLPQTTVTLPVVSAQSQGMETDERFQNLTVHQCQFVVTVLSTRWRESVRTC